MSTFILQVHGKWLPFLFVMRYTVCVPDRSGAEGGSSCGFVRLCLLNAAIGFASHKLYRTFKK